MPQKSQKSSNLGPQKRPKTGKTGSWCLEGQNSDIWGSRIHWETSVRGWPRPVRVIQKLPIFAPQKFEFPAFFFEKFFFKKIILKPIFNNEPMKFGKNLIYYTNILHEKWHILKENQNLSWDQNEQNNT